MRHYLRRIILFPFIVIACFGIYLLGWLLYGHDEASKIVDSLIKNTWEGK